MRAKPFLFLSYFRCKKTLLGISNEVFVGFFLNTNGRCFDTTFAFVESDRSDVYKIVIIEYIAHCTVILEYIAHCTLICRPDIII